MMMEFNYVELCLRVGEEGIEMDESFEMAFFRDEVGGCSMKSGNLQATWLGNSARLICRCYDRGEHRR